MLILSDVRVSASMCVHGYSRHSLCGIFTIWF